MFENTNRKNYTKFIADKTGLYLVQTANEEKIIKMCEGDYILFYSRDNYINDVQLMGCHEQN
jgi:hypothetical protein